MRSNTKQVKAAVRQHIAECTDLTDYAVTPGNDAQRILAIFKSEKAYKIKQLGEQGAFMDWLTGLPTCLQVEMCYSEVREILINRFKTNTPAKRDDDKSFNFFLCLIYREVKEMSQEPDKQS